MLTTHDPLEDLKKRIKVLVEPSMIWHWRDADNNPLCNTPLQDPVLMSYSEAGNFSFRCVRCMDVGSSMFYGWKGN